MIAGLRPEIFWEILPPPRLKPFFLAEVHLRNLGPDPCFLAEPAMGGWMDNETDGYRAAEEQIVSRWKNRKRPLGGNINDLVSELRM